MSAIERILEKIEIQILKLVSSPQINTEGLTDLLSAYELFTSKLEQKKTALNREQMFNSGNALKARARAFQKDPMSLMKILKGINARNK